MNTKYSTWAEYHWDNPPKPFNPSFDPHAKARAEQVTASMEADNYYTTHTRVECQAEWAKRYDGLKYN